MADRTGNAEVLVPVLLAGGSGTRLWPVSRTVVPKHLAPLLGRESLLQQTARRVLGQAPPERVITVGAAPQELLLRRQLAEVASVLGRNLLLEPRPRNTAAAIAVAALRAMAEFGPGSILLVCPSDHLLTRPEELEAAVRASLEAAAAGRIVTFGITPARPETGFGYIAVGEGIERWPGLHEVREFVEKPELARARAMLESGGHLWNAGIFLMRADTVLEELDRFEPEIAAGSRRAFEAAGGRPELPEDLYARIPSAPIDKAVMERSRRVAVAPCDPGWSDVGSWHALWELATRDERGNLGRGDVHLEEVSDCLVEARERLVVLAGVRDLAVIETADAVLVAGREASDAIKAAVAALARAGRQEVDRHLAEARAWGEEVRVADRPGYRIVERRVAPGARVRLDAGSARLRLVIAGRGEIAGEGRRVGPGDLLSPAPDTGTAIRSSGEEPLVLLEILPGTAEERQL